MCNNKDKGVFSATVRYNEPIGEYYYRLSLLFEGDGASCFAKALPGQFLEVKVESLSCPAPEDIPENLRDAAQRSVILRRPFSFVDVFKIEDNKTVVDIIYLITGASTVRMTTISPGDTLSFTGPLGNGFAIPSEKKCVILVAGGVGVPPVEHVARWLSENKPELKTVAFIGARSKEHLPFASTLSENCENGKVGEFAQIGVDSFTTTDDGSFGDKGFVTSRLEQWLAENEITASDAVILSCGPEPMLMNLSKLAQKWDIDCQVSLERQMACGIGLCQSCAVEIKVNDNEETVYKLCCKDGPVFNSQEVVW